MMLEQMIFLMEIHKKKKNLDPYLTPYTFIWDGSQVLPSTKPKTKKLLGESIALGDVKLGKGFLGHTRQSP